MTEADIVARQSHWDAVIREEMAELGVEATAGGTGGSERTPTSYVQSDAISAAAHSSLGKSDSERSAAGEVASARGDGPDGTYASADNGYVIQAKFSPGKLTVIEPNKTSVYVQRSGTSI